MTDVERLKAQVMTSIVEHLIASGGALATPGSEVARVRRDVMRGLRDARLTRIGSARSHH